ncbi:hypothetical protein Dimus_001565, partial [Dionaea muscipula]
GTTASVPDLNEPNVHIEATADLPQEVEGPGDDPSGKNLDDIDGVEAAATMTSIGDRVDPSIDHVDMLEEIRVALDQSRAACEQ